MTIEEFQLEKIKLQTQIENALYAFTEKTKVPINKLKVHQEYNSFGEYLYIIKAEAVL